MKLLWVGPLTNDYKGMINTAISPAANRWQLSLIEGLIDLGCKTQVLSYIPYPSYPKGKVIIKGNHTKIRGISTIQVPYLNLPIYRKKSLLKAFKCEYKLLQDCDVIITYNASHQNTALAKYLKKHFEKKWVSIIAEGDFDNGADLTVFLSYFLYKNSSLRKMHLDGGVETFIADSIQSTRGEKVILFSGALNKWTGIEEFAKVFCKLELPGVVLHIYGKGDSRILKRLAEKNRSIIIKGFVDEMILEQAKNNAFVFVNPRPTDIEGGDNNFPSKVLDYMKHGKPIISTRTKGLAPYYDDLLFYYDPASESSLFRLLNSILNLTQSEKRILSCKIKNFCVEHSWTYQANRLIQEIGNI